MLRYPVCTRSMRVRRWRRILATQASILSSHEQPRRTIYTSSAKKDWTTAYPCGWRRTYCTKDPYDVDRYFRSWEERENDYVEMDAVIYLKEALMELSADKKSSKIVLNHPGYLSLRQYIIDTVRNQSTKNIAFVLWLCGRYKLQDKELHKAMINELEPRNPELLSDKQLGLVPWSLTVLGYHQSSWVLMETCVDEVIKRMNKGDLNDHHTISQLCWCFVIAHHWPTQFTVPLGKYIDKYVWDFAPHTLSIITWALQKYGLVDLAQLTKHTRVARSNFSKSNMKSHSMMLWSLGNAQHFDQPYFEKLTEDIMSGKLLNEIDTQLLVAIMQTCVRVRYHHYDLLEQLSATFLERINDFSLQELAKTVHSFSFLNHISLELLEVATKRFCTKYTGRKGLEEIFSAVTMIYACLVGNVYLPELLTIIMDMLKNDKELLNVQGWNNLQWIMQLSIGLLTEHPDLEIPPIPLTYKLGLLDYRMKNYTKRISSFQSQVRRCLLLALRKKKASLKYVALCTNTYSINLELLLDKNNQLLIPTSTKYRELQNNPDVRLQGVFSNYTRSELFDSLSALPGSDTKTRQQINFASDWGWEWSDSVSRRIAVEIDGPTQFSVNDNHPLGKSVLKKRQLRALGWEVIQVPYFEWENFSTSQAVSYLRRKVFGSQPTFHQ